jgi:hypothetical protein
MFTSSALGSTAGVLGRSPVGHKRSERLDGFGSCGDVPRGASPCSVANPQNAHHYGRANKLEDWLLELEPAGSGRSSDSSFRCHSWKRPVRAMLDRKVDITVSSMAKVTEGVRLGCGGFQESV